MITTELTEGVLSIVLNRPARLNALTLRMQARLLEILEEASRDPSVRVVVISGAGNAFCAGFDIRDGLEGAEDDAIAERWAQEKIWMEVEQVAQRLRHDAEILTLLHTMPKVTIAVMRGPAAGSGLCMAAACDLRIASSNAVFKTAFSTLGRCGDPGGSYLISKLVGGGKARELYFLDEKIDAGTALSIGLVNRVVPDDQLNDESAQLALRLARGPGLAYGYIKRNINAAENSTLAETIEFESYSNARASMSEDAKEAVAAFLGEAAGRFQRILSRRPSMPSAHDVSRSEAKQIIHPHGDRSSGQRVASTSVGFPTKATPSAFMRLLHTTNPYAKY